jgi:hypothetical protein
MRILIIFVLIICSNGCTPQDTSVSQNIKKPETDEADSTCFDCFTQAEYIGGDSALFKFLRSNINYPKQAIELKVYGKVLITFTVDETGKATDVKLYKGINPSIIIDEKIANGNQQKKYQEAANQLNEEALRVVRLMSSWKPATQEGKLVKTQYLLPISFKL